MMQHRTGSTRSSVYPARRDDGHHFGRTARRLTPIRASERAEPSSQLFDAITANVAPRPPRQDRTRSNSRSCACSPRATCWSRTCPASARPAWPRRCRRRSTARGSASSSRPTCCRPTWSASASTRARPRRSGSSPVRCSPTSCSPTRSTGRRRRRSRRCSRRWRSARSPSTASAVRSPPPFMVIATQNPVEQEGTYRLPESQLDRFLLRISIGYPGRDGRDPDARRPRVGRGACRRSSPVVSADEVLDDDRRRALGVRRQRTQVVPGRLAEASRRHSGHRTRALAASHAAARRGVARPTPLRRAATTPPPTTSRRSACPRFSHRIVVRADHGSQLSPEDAIREVFDAVPVPVARCDRER